MDWIKLKTKEEIEAEDKKIECDIQHPVVYTCSAEDDIFFR